MRVFFMLSRYREPLVAGEYRLRLERRGDSIDTVLHSVPNVTLRIDKALAPGRGVWVEMDFDDSVPEQREAFRLRDLQQVVGTAQR